MSAGWEACLQGRKGEKKKKADYMLYDQRPSCRPSALSMSMVSCRDLTKLDRFCTSSRRLEMTSASMGFSICTKRRQQGAE